MWFYYALFFALWSAVSTVIIKRLTSNLSSFNILFFTSLCSLPFIFILILLQGGFPKVTPEFYKLMFSSSVIDFVAFLLAIEGIRRSSVSLVSPMSSFSPVFTTFIAMFTLGEFPPTYKLFAIFVIVIGAYVLQASKIKDGLLEPLKKLVSDQGVRLYFSAMFLWAITPIFQKKAIFETSPTLPLMASFMGLLFVFIYISPLALKNFKNVALIFKKNYIVFVPYGFLNALAQLAAYEAFSLEKVGYVTSIFRLSGVFGVIGGAIFFKEGKIKEKLIGAVIMVIGAVILLS